jgi:hypothetical protein
MAVPLDGRLARFWDVDWELELATVFVANAVSGSTDRPHEEQKRLLSLMSVLHDGHFSIYVVAASIHHRTVSLVNCPLQA